MLISPHEQERLLIHVAAGLAKERRARGLRLNYPEATALITSFLLEGARDGRPVVELMATGRTVLTRDDVMGGGAGQLRRAGVTAPCPPATRCGRGCPRCSPRCRSSPPSRTAQSWSPCTSRSHDPWRDPAW